ncbi:leucine--tRNA ligase [Candidatus Shikimatogenerans silvanidophilus]|uniref:leucine--tRNA ligase n=1 Tax=Candidatus Shikimatogenerans silvanidophilus TaxID=2782547 RepID=UPI001BA5E0B2|nr:leucine--tRNA ligase [Candidatus Shikimatogenerans silvanidophilus]
MLKYNFKKIENFSKKKWKISNFFNKKKKSKIYILDMFPYPSGDGLHIGHTIGYIASDIYTKYKILKGYNVLHPIGFDSFGLPTEQYAFQIKKHPKLITNINIKNYKKQLKNIGLFFNWEREIITSDPSYYKWTQWIFIKLFNSWYDNKKKKTRSINDLIKIFNKEGNINIFLFNNRKQSLFSNKEWKKFSNKKKENILQNYRLAFISERKVNWCPELSTVLANDEVKNGRSERGGFPVYKKKMKQWSIRITDYSERLLKDIKKINCTKNLKNIQNNWIGKSKGVELIFKIKNKINISNINIFTKEPENIFGISFIAISTEHNLVNFIKRKKIKYYIKKIEKSYLNKDSNLIGYFTKIYAIHPFTKKEIPIYITNYVMEYGSYSIMGVPNINKIDYNFAKKFNLPIIKILNKKKIFINSYFLNNLNKKKAIEKINYIIKKKKIGIKKINYKLKDAVFSRQRYWGEPIPIYYYKNNIPKTINNLPLILPDIKYKLFNNNGESPLKKEKNWAWNIKKKKIVNKKKIDNLHTFPIETDTMPSWAASSWYYLRYMDSKNYKKIVSAKKEKYWKNVDLYIGGIEHATGHLIYSRFFHKFLNDIGIVSTIEPFNKIINQGLILGKSVIISKINKTNNFISYDLIKKKNDIQNIYISNKLLKKNNNFDENNIENNNCEIDLYKLKKWRKDFKNNNFILNKGKFIAKIKIEKMSKSKYNTINPDKIIKKFGVDSFRLYEMFLGPLNQNKIWDNKGIVGTYQFLKKFWNLFYSKGKFYISNKKPNKEELKILHYTILKIEKNIKNFEFNTSISLFMITLKKLIKINCNKKSILKKLLIIFAPFAPNFSEFIWNKIGENKSIFNSKFPIFKKKYIISNNVKYYIMINNKIKLKIYLNKNEKNIEKKILKNKKINILLNNKKIKKILIIKEKKIINILI